MTGSGPLGHEPAGRFNFEPICYFPPEDVRAAGGERPAPALPEEGRGLALHDPGRLREDLLATLEPPDTVTRCPYKGTASYHSVRLESGEVATDLVWFYDEPLAEVGRIAELLCFFDEKVDVELDGELQQRPESPWSRGVKSDAQNAPVAQTRG